MPIRHRHMIRKLYHQCKTPMRIRTPKSANHNIKVQRQDSTRTRPPCAIPRTIERTGETRESSRPESDSLDFWDEKRSRSDTTLKICDRSLLWQPKAVINRLKHA